MTKLLYGSYGHHPSGKQYIYYGDDNHRAGESVVAPVTNKWTNRTYNTMFTIQRTSKLDTPYSLDQVEKLNGRGINIKTITPGLNLSTLPGSKPFNRKSEWKKYSDYVYHKNIKSRLTGKKQNILTIEDFRKLQKLSTPKPPKVKEPAPFRFKGVTLDQVLSGEKKIKLPNWHIKSKYVTVRDKETGKIIKDENGKAVKKKVYDFQLFDKIKKKLTKGYLPEIRTKKVWNTDTWEYDKQVIYKPPKTAFDRIKENYQKMLDNPQKESARKRLLGE